jgi:integrase
LRYRRPGDGRPAKLTLGRVYDAEKRSEIDVKPVIGGYLSLRSAHRLVAELKHELAFGRDPGRTYIEQKRKIATSDNFGGAALDFVEQHAMRKTRRGSETARLLGFQQNDAGSFELIPKGLAMRWRDRPIAEIDGDDIHSIVDETREKGAPGLLRRNKKPSESMARSMYAVLSAMFGWLVQRRRLKANPIVGVHRPDMPKARERVLTDAEIVKFWSATEEVSSPFGPLLKLLLLTGARLNEIAMARRSELSDNGATLTIPAERSKNHRAHAISLSQLAQRLLKRVKTAGDLIFTTTGTSPVSGWSKLKKKLDVAMGVSDWRFHDLRRTAVTGMNEIGVMPHVVEAVVNHVSGHRGGVAGVYNRAQYADEKRVALERWTAHVEGLISQRPANVTPMIRKKRI